MKYIRKSVSLIAILSLIFAFSFTSVDAGTIYESKTKETVTSGVTLETITRFTDGGWQKINVLRVNLDNPNVKVDTLTSSESIKKLSNVKNLAQSAGAVAAVNASFFNWLKEAGQGYPDGPVIQSGEFLSVDSEYNRYNNSMATLAIDNENNMLYDFWKTDIDILAPDGSTARVTQYNKPSSAQYNDITIWSRAWDKDSLGVSQEYPDVVEVVVNDGTVMEIRQNLPSVEIPQNGYVIITRGANAQHLVQSFEVGDTVDLSISTVLDWENIEMAVTGSAILVKDGQIPENFSYDINGVHPRTAAGSSKFGKELILVTVDGRQAASKGMSQRELADLMLSLGAYNAINFDGGGSTSMVSRIPATNNLKVVNTPSDGSLRSISTAIGIFSVMPPSSLEGMIIESQPNAFVNTSTALSVKGYDKYFNPIEIDLASIEWSVSGIEGSFDKNTFRPESSGIGTITASVDGNVKASTTIRALEAPNKLVLSDKQLHLVKGNSHSLTVKGIDNNGYSSSINPADINWTFNGDIVSLEKNTVTALNTGTGYIEASLGDVRAYCGVSVASESVRLIDSFEVLNGSFLTSPKDLPGSYELTKEDKKSGNYSGKLSYDFSYLDGTRAAYVVFPNGGIDLDSNAIELSMWVNNPHESPNWLRAEVVDARGQKHLIDFTRDMNWSGWKRVFASLQSVKSPAKLTKVYVVQINPVPDSGSIYLDDISLKKATFPEIKEDTVPKDVILSDKDNREAVLDDDSIKFSVFSGKSNPENMLQKLLNTRFSDKVKADDYMKNTQNISDIKAHTHLDIANSRLIVLNTSEKSIRTSAAGQWQWFLDKLNSSNGDNVFIFMKNSFDTFTDPLEAKLFKDILVEYKQKTGKNIWVFYNGSSDVCYSENGIKYLGTAGLNMSGLTPDNAQDVKYIEITVNGKEVSYQYKSAVEVAE